MSTTQLRLKFKNGDIVTNHDFGELVRHTDGTDLITTFEKIKELDSPISLKGNDGFEYLSSGKELVSVEIILK